MTITFAANAQTNLASPRVLWRCLTSLLSLWSSSGSHQRMMVVSRLTITWWKGWIWTQVVGCLLQSPRLVAAWLMFQWFVSIFIYILYMYFLVWFLLLTEICDYFSLVSCYFFYKSVICTRYVSSFSIIYILICPCFWYMLDATDPWGWSAWPDRG